MGTAVKVVNVYLDSVEIDETNRIVIIIAMVR